MERLGVEVPCRQLSPVLVEIPASARSDMRVAARVWADDELWQQIRGDRTLDEEEHRPEPAYG